MQYRYISKISSLGCRSEIELQYYDCWKEAVSQLTQLLDSQLLLVQRIQQNNSDHKTKGIPAAIIQYKTIVVLTKANGMQRRQ